MYKNEDTGQILDKTPENEEFNVEEQSESSPKSQESEKVIELQSVSVSSSPSDDTSIHFIRYYDSDEDDYYFENVLNGSMSFKMPPNGKWINETDSKGMQKLKEKQKLKARQKKKKRRQMELEDGTQTSNTRVKITKNIPVWIRTVDSTTGVFSYENEKTGEMQEEEPPHPFLWRSPKESDRKQGQGGETGPKTDFEKWLDTY